MFKTISNYYLLIFFKFSTFYNFNNYLIGEWNSQLSKNNLKGTFLQNHNSKIIQFHLFENKKKLINVNFSLNTLNYQYFIIDNLSIFKDIINLTNKNNKYFLTKFNFEGNYYKIKFLNNYKIQIKIKN